MPLTPQLFYSDLVQFRSAGPHGFGGVPFDQLALGLGQALVAWAPSVTLAGVTTGTAGAGVINPATSKLVVPPSPGLVIAALKGAGLQGPLGDSLGVVVGLAVAQTVTAYGGYVGASAGVGVGSDVSRVVSAPSLILSGHILSMVGAMLGTGPALSMLALGLGQGISSMLLLGTGVAAVTGTPTPSPASGVSTCVLV